MTRRKLCSRQRRRRGYLSPPLTRRTTGSLRRSRILRWEGNHCQLSDENKDELLRGLLHLLMVSQSVRILEMDSVEGFSPNWMRYTRMKDFPKLEFLRVWFCALWTWESLKIANNFRASVLDLDVSTDIHFQVDVYLPFMSRTLRFEHRVLAVGSEG
ncbi:hypothetical protein DTO021C3_5097 [Paecilomyces variotii]|nr:hypothetical protein DTO021C3_5097 [Paecilomyces variotii]